MLFLGVAVLSALPAGFRRPLGVPGKISRAVLPAFSTGFGGFFRVLGKIARTVLATLVSGLGRPLGIIGEVSGIVLGATAGVGLCPCETTGARGSVDTIGHDDHPPEIALFLEISLFFLNSRQGILRRTYPGRICPGRLNGAAVHEFLPYERLEPTSGKAVSMKSGFHDRHAHAGTRPGEGFPMHDGPIGDPPFSFARLEAVLDDLEREASANDPDATFPDEGIQTLRRLGVMSLALPRPCGGRGWGTEPGGELALLHLLRLTGRASLALGRVLEGHVNALRLVAQYGRPDQMHQVAADIRGGALLGLWVSDGPVPVGMRVERDRIILQGAKSFASGALHVTHPLVTAIDPDGASRMILAPPGADRRAVPSVGGLTGMRGAETGHCDLGGLILPTTSLVGQGGDYLRQPEFSAGAWRGMAVALGGMDRLVDLLRQQLVARSRADNPHQQIRIGEALIARDTAFFWTRHAALAAGARDRDGVAQDDMTQNDMTRNDVAQNDTAQTVNLARIAVERAALTLIERVQRGLGLSAFVRTNLVERVLRDLATYLRQPAPDETLAEAAGWFTGRDPPHPDPSAPFPRANGHPE
jgi:alkylation response protein AidB-like acyl-CoA dehydrogenase